MLTAFRQFARSWVAAIIIGLIIVAFAIVGTNSFIGGPTGDQVIKAGSRVVDSMDFRRAYDNAKRRFEQQSGQPITTEMAEANGLDRFVLGQLASQEAFGELLHRMGVRPSDQLLVAQIEKEPAFFDPITGRFDRKTFERLLGENNLTPELFEAEIRDQLAGQHWAAGVANGLRVPRMYGALLAVFGLETRDIAYFEIPPGSVPQPAAPTDAQLLAFMKQNMQPRPETRVLTVVRFTAPADAATGPISDAELKKRFDFRRDTLSQPETRSLVQIPAKDANAARQIAERLRKGEAPAAVAKAFGVDAITYENKPLTAIADRKVGEAAFRMQAGEVGPVQGDLGSAVVQILAVSPGRQVTLEEARPMLEAEIRKDQAAEKVYAMTQVYEDAHQAGANLVESAKKAGVPITTVGPVTKEGQGLTQETAGGLNPSLLQQAFELPVGGESEVTETGNGEYAAVRVERIIPSALPPLDEVRPQLVDAWRQREIDRALEARATQLADRVRKGEAIEAVAASAGYTVSRLTGLSRQSAGQDRTLPQEVLVRGFGEKPGQVFTARLAPMGRAVGVAGNVQMVPTPIAAQIAESQLYARNKLKVRVNAEQARAAVGFEPASPPAKGKAEKAK
jgi:peptidyl-prolyl cis-trans isomerase D